MSRPTPIPEVIITHNLSFDSETGSNIINIVIDIKAGEFSNGFVSLDEPGDLHILRDAIDKFISNNNIKREDYMDKQTNETKQEQLKPAWVTILEGYLNGLMPADEPGPGVTMKTSADIVNDLDDMVDISVDEVSAVMANLGYKAHFNPEGGHGWLIMKAPFDTRGKLVSTKRE